MSFVCDDIVIPMEIAQDHKCAFDNDEGQYWRNGV